MLMVETYLPRDVFCKGDAELIRECRNGVNFAASQLRRLIVQYPDFFPMYTAKGKWKHENEAWTNWCEGFLGGQLWLIYKYTRDPWWLEQAKHYSRLIEPRKNDRTVHDLGFLFWPTWKRWYDLEGEKQVNDVVIAAGQTLALRFMEKGKFLRSFVSAESLFIDIMMNVGIIFYAAEQTQDEKLRQVADQHCQTTRRYLVRGDGSTAHEGVFNIDTGEFLRQSTHQGWRGDSSWARGQAWALYGFGTVYEFTKSREYLETAESCADFFIRRTPGHGIPPNDWEEPDPATPYESSAAAIAASGLFRLSSLTDSPERAKKYSAVACSIMRSLLRPEFMATEEPEWEGVLKHGIYHQRKQLGVDESVMWGDYFFLEAIDFILENYTPQLQLRD
jgi:unsaturated chondroitin disaccharide hydrolase